MNPYFFFFVCVEVFDEDDLAAEDLPVEVREGDCRVDRAEEDLFPVEDRDFSIMEDESRDDALEYLSSLGF